MSVTFDRSIPPRKVKGPRFPRPMISHSQESKVQIRTTLAKGRRWREFWPPLDLSIPAVRAFLSDIRQWAADGETVLVRPYDMAEGRFDAAGTLPADSTGTVNGAGQTGSSLITAGWGAGTIAKGDYIVIAGFPYSQDIRANVTPAGGAATLSLYPSIYLGTVPADGATITLNGLMRCYISDLPEFPESIGVDTVEGLSVAFREKVSLT